MKLLEWCSWDSSVVSSSKTPSPRPAAGPQLWRSGNLGSWRSDSSRRTHNLIARQARVVSTFRFWYSNDIGKISLTPAHNDMLRQDCIGLFWEAQKSSQLLGWSTLTYINVSTLLKINVLLIRTGATSASRSAMQLTEKSNPHSKRNQSTRTPPNPNPHHKR